MSAVFKLDKAKIRHSFGVASVSYDGVAELQRTVGRQLIEKGPLPGLSGVILDLGCGTGFLTGELLKLQAAEQILALDLAMPMLQTARRKLSAHANVNYLCADAERMALAANSVDGIVSNLALQWCRDLASVFGDCQKILKPAGLLAFSTFGPKTLCELKQAWAAVDEYSHVNDFYGAEELARFLAHAGFVDIQLETQCHRPVYASVLDLMRELKGIGAHNVAAGRNRKMTTKAQMQQMISSYPKETLDDRIVATFEVVTVTARI
ncbi:MAG: malonyl-ACP O-methyltransferase BioC [Gammaproteobacteria bacterium]